MGYEEALVAAGCRVIAYQEFGSYQGDWLAFVVYNGEKGMVMGAYGSCSGCDAFHAEFDYDDPPCIYCGEYYKNGDTWLDKNKCTKEEYEELLLKAEQRLADFGRTYLSGGLTDRAYFERGLAGLMDDDWFDEESKEMYTWALAQDWN